ncbi:MAG TPA: PASTA domain-containing protein, partial [Planctomycetaceae bacterium]|nr:PASTA domain-containing protein [Planctomycetaceae bacterium]
TLQLDQQERWICNGETIWRIDDTKQEVEIFPLPEEARGKNIIDGPLPFLFGLPPEKAKLRFEFELKRETANEVWLRIRPRLSHDAQNWSVAEVMLMKDKNYLPSAVKLIDPAGNEETVYAFERDKLKIGPQRGLLPVPWGRKDPFDPDIPRGYKVTQHRLEQPLPQGPPTTLPSFIGLHGTRALNVLKELDCQVTFEAGEVAPDEKLVHTVYRQQPAARTPLQKGLPVLLTYYVAPPAPQPQAEQRPPQPAADSEAAAAPRQDAPVEVPDLRRLHWRRAKTELDRAGFNVQWVEGPVTTRAELTNTVYNQEPAAGTNLKPGELVKVIVYVEPKTAANQQ